MLFAQPVPRFAYVIGKFIAYLAIFGAVLLLFSAGLYGRSGKQKIAMLYGQTYCSRPRFLRSDWPRGFSHTIAPRHSSSV